jgi:hypothetical protein
MTTTKGRKELEQAARRLAKDKFKIWLERNVSDPKAVAFMLDQFELAYDLIVDSIANGSMPSKGDVIRFLGSKANTFARFSESSRVECVSSIVSLGLTASAAPAAGAGGPIAWTWYVGAVLLDGLDVGGNCYLAFQDSELDRKTEEFRRQIEARRAWGHANAVCSVAHQQSLASGLEAILNYQSRRPVSTSGLP